MRKRSFGPEIRFIFGIIFDLIYTCDADAFSPTCQEPLATVM